MSNKINIYRGSKVVCTLPLSASMFTKRLMSEHNLEFNYTSPGLLDLRIGDTLTYNGEVMTVNKTPEVLRTHEFQYTFKFQGHRHTLERYILKDEGALSFSYFGTPSDYLFMFLECVNSVDSGWVIGEVDELEPVHVDFDKVSCFDALSMIAEAFKGEWQIIGKKISLVKHIGVVTTLKFEYGKGNGLYSLNRIHEDSSKVVTRAYAEGGIQNLPKSYTKPPFRLNDYIEDDAAITLYGIREGVFQDEEIYPKRTSTATGVGQINEGTFTLIDTAIDFDLEGQRISGTEGKIVFKSGMLNEQEFKILSYNHSRKEIRYEANKDSLGNLTPFGVTLAEIGDKYTLIGIRMPDSYETSAIAELTSKRLEYLQQNKIPRVRYELDIDVLNLRKLNVEPREGDLIRIKDSNLGIDDEIRITSISYPGHYKNTLESGMKFTCEVGNDVHYMRVEKVEKDIKKTQEVVVSTSQSMIEYNRLQSLATSQFRSMVFDPDNNLQGTFQALMIQAMSAVFGTDSQNFDLVGIFIRPNADNNANKITFTAGQLVHYSYSIEGVGNTWIMTSYSNDALVSGYSYYVSAKCSKNELSGIWVLSTAPIGTDDEAGYWHFNLGVISSVIEGQRFANITKGYTFVSGGQIQSENLISRHIQTATSGARTTINVLPSDPSDPTSKSEYYVTNAIRQYHESGRISMYDGIVKNLVISVVGTTRTISGQARVVFKDQIGSPLLYVVDSFTQNGMQYVTVDSIKYYQVTGHSFITNTLNHNASDTDLIDFLFNYSGSTAEYIPKSMWCGYYEMAIYALSLGLSAEGGSVWQRVSTSEGTTFVTLNNGNTPITEGWYYRLGDYMEGVANSANDHQIIFNLKIQLQYVNSAGVVQVVKNLTVNNIKWFQGTINNNTCTSGTPQIQIQ